MLEWQNIVFQGCDVPWTTIPVMESIE